MSTNDGTFPVRPLRRLAKVINGGTPGPAVEFWNGDVSWATPVDLGRAHGSTLTSTERTITEAGLVAGSNSLPAGNVLLSSRAPIGYVAVTAVKTAFNQGCKGIVASPGTDPKFLAYALQHCTPLLTARGRGTTFLEVNAADVAAVPIPAPSYDEQRRIADFLDHETAEIDAFMAEQTQLIDLTAEKRAAAIDEVLLQATTERIALKHLGFLSTGLTLGATYSEQTETYPYIRVANVQANRLDLSTVTTVELPASVAARVQLFPGDVLMTEGGDRDKLGRGALWSGEVPGALHQNHVFAFRCSPRLLPEFLVYALEATEARSYFEATASQSTNLASTNSTLVKRFKVPRLDPGAQRQLVAILDRELGILSEAADDARLLIALAQERRAALISAAVTGQIDVTERRKPAVDQLQDEIEETR